VPSIPIWDDDVFGGLFDKAAGAEGLISNIDNIACRSTKEKEK
jgi:hypothetical protein